jgi:hypothetical protein
MQVHAMAPVSKRGTTYQSDGKDFTKVTEYFVGGGG